MGKRPRKPGGGRRGRPEATFRVNAVARPTPDLHLLAQVVLNAAVRRAGDDSKNPQPKEAAQPPPRR
jgi:hypothetical protein